MKYKKSLNIFKIMFVKIINNKFQKIILLKLNFIIIRLNK